MFENVHFAQNINSDLLLIKIRQIDSICLKIDSTLKTGKKIMKHISEGSNMNESGGFSIYTFSDFSNLDSLVLHKVIKNESNENHSVSKYYFDQKQLLKVEVDVKKYNDYDIVNVYSAVYYFQNDMILRAFNHDDEFVEIDKILKSAKDHLREFYEK